MLSKYLEAVKTYAVEEGLPYQILISSLLHKFVIGRLVDIQSGVGNKIEYQINYLKIK